MLTMFRTYDVNHDGILDESEFLVCLQSLDLQLTIGEMSALFAAADTKCQGFLKFDDFSAFLSHNLINLEREKHIRVLQKAMHNDNSSGGANSANEAVASATASLTQRWVCLYIN